MVDHFCRARTSTCIKLYEDRIVIKIIIAFEGTIEFWRILFDFDDRQELLLSSNYCCLQFGAEFRNRVYFFTTDKWNNIIWLIFPKFKEYITIDPIVQNLILLVTQDDHFLVSYTNHISDSLHIPITIVSIHFDILSLKIELHSINDSFIFTHHVHGCLEWTLKLASTINLICLNIGLILSLGWAIHNIHNILS